ncbi:MAG: hypothetical protein ABSG76_12910, partial [Xanthobacteraceae bacterium]
FFDTAGEDMNSQETMAYVNRYIFRSDGIILLVDPLQLDFVQSKFAASLNSPLPDRETETSDIVSRLISLIHEGRRASAGDQIGIPLALTLSKFDTVEPLVDPGLVVTKSSHQIGGFDAGDFQTINAEVQALIDRWGGAFLLQQIRTAFRHSGFFAVSALGSAPRENSMFTVRPKRVADPFLWILYVHRLIKARPESP